MSAVLDMWGLPGGQSIHSNLLSYSWGVNDSVFGRYSAHVPPNYFAVTRKPDRFSSLLLGLCASGDSIDLMKVTLSYTDDDGRAAKGGLTFSDSTVVSLGGSGRGHSSERITICFGSFAQEY